MYKPHYLGIIKHYPTPVPTPSMLSGIILLILRPIILRNPIDQKTIHAPPQTIQPEQVQCLQTRQQAKRDDLRNPTLVLLCFPIEFVRPDSLKCAAGEKRNENAQVDIMA